MLTLAAATLEGSIALIGAGLALGAVGYYYSEKWGVIRMAWSAWACCAGATILGGLILGVPMLLLYLGVAYYASTIYDEPRRYPLLNWLPSASLASGRA